MDHLYFYTVLFFTAVLFANSQDPRISSKLGEIVGKIKSVPIEGLPYQNVHEYLGIPFAKPPVGELRFRKPEPMTSLPSPFYAQSHGAICPQITMTPVDVEAEQSEDCLFLNVYVPDRPADKPTGHAVMVWIYGGGFVEGASNFYDCSTLSIAGNIIVVTINYRLNVFGFLNTGDENARGNFGLWDQHSALQWVHDNIGDFGGDNQRVTIAGESAGAMSVMTQAITPGNRGLFQRAIAQSGSMSMPVLDFERDGLKDTITLAGSLGCETDSMVDLMRCLREKSVDEYLTAVYSLLSNVSYSPVLDNDFIKVNPRYIAKMSEIRSLDEIEFFRSVDILSGFNAFEGALFLPFIMDPTKIENMQPTRQEMKRQYLPAAMNMLYRTGFADEIMNLVEAHYTNWSNPDDFHSIRLQITKLLGDASFGVPAVEMARLHKISSASRNFMYHFAPKPSVRLLPTPTWIPGSNHADEIGFIFGSPNLGVGDGNAWETDLIIKMITYWTNFIKSGDPNSPESVTPSWPEYSIDNGDYLVLDKSMSDESAKQHFYAEEANFWLEIFPDLVEAVQGDGKGGCGDGTFTSSAPNVPVYGSVSFITAVILTFVSFF
ncbi:carboxylesterase 5A-like [Mercenaria mercenaria]|uniref:carboxylesterase 5A-like n=1 Tax=Mercenaria mercenaria TaxID=6596 RepID=UPI00234F56B2|nr:carboxylesterase 5A-like [Mercenaria mercenaria]